MKIGLHDNIKDLAPLLAFHLMDNEETLEEFKNGFIEYQRKIEGFIPLVGKGHKYFSGHLHDSPILSFNVKNNDLSLILNDSPSLQFACALIDKKNLEINKEKLIFPLEIKTEETEHLSLNTIDDNGQIHENKFTKLKEYLYEEVIDWTDENIEMAFDLWSGKEPHWRYLLLVKCKRIKFIENQGKYWKKYFSDQFNDYYDYFVDERNNGTYLSDYSLCENLIDTIDRIKNFKNNLIE